MRHYDVAAPCGPVRAVAWIKPSVVHDRGEGAGKGSKASKENRPKSAPADAARAERAEVSHRERARAGPPRHAVDFTTVAEKINLDAPNPVIRGVVRWGPGPLKDKDKDKAGSQGPLHQSSPLQIST